MVGKSVFWGWGGICFAKCCSGLCCMFGFTLYGYSLGGVLHVSLEHLHLDTRCGRSFGLAMAITSYCPMYFGILIPRSAYEPIPVR